MKETTKRFGIAVAIAPAMSAHGYGTDDGVDKLVSDLENAVAS